MKGILQVIFILIFPLPVFSQEAHLARLPISGWVRELGISPSEEVWVATTAGNIYYTRHAGDLWHLGPFGSFAQNQMGETFDRINFFSEDTLMISGYLHDGDKRSFVYWSGNYGKTWEKVFFDQSSWMDAAYINHKGKAWISSSFQHIYYTANNGKDWTAFDNLKKFNDLRFSSIFFSKDEKTGLFGAYNNVIYKTANNCKSWKRITTPLDQKKYQNLSDEANTDIEKIRLFGRYYIVNQHGRVFITNSGHIDWKYLPDIADFEVTENGALYTVNRDESISIYNCGFVKTWQSRQKLTEAPMAIGVRNDKLFALTAEYLYKISTDEFTSSQVFTDELPIPEPGLKLTFQGRQLGFESRDVLCFDTATARWFRIMTLDFPISNAIVFNGQLLVSDIRFNYHKLNPDTRSITDYNLPANLFTGQSVTEMDFECEVWSCGGVRQWQRSYLKRFNEFVADKSLSSPEYLPGAVNEIDEATVRKLIEEIQRSRFSGISIADLGLSNEDIQSFQKYIDRESRRIKTSGVYIADRSNLYEFPGEHTDFGFYKSAAAGLFKLRESTVNSVFQQSGGKPGTTIIWRRVIFVFGDGKKLTIENSDYKPNYLYTPWQVDYDGIKFTANSIKFGQYIDEITNKQFFDKNAREKNYAIFKITDYLYKKKLQDR